MSTPDHRPCPACERAPAKLRCSGCHRVWYCNTQCQRNDWPIHIFNCKNTQPIKTSYYLAQAARQDSLPTDPQTLKDYGFERAVTNAEKTMLLGLYIGLFERLGANPKDVNRWMINGTLVKEIKAVYETLPTNSRGGYYPWFLENQHIIDSSITLPKSTQHHVDDAVTRVWRLAGGSSKDSKETIMSQISQFSAKTQLCYELYTILLLDDMTHPHPSSKTWVAFGFCFCRDEHDESRVSRLYRQLIERCTFNEFVIAYEAAKLVQLCESKGLPCPPQIPQAFAPIESVWYLKQFVEVHDFPDFQPPLSVHVDYGFMNCKDESEVVELKALYKQIFDMPEVSPLELHKSCIKGELYEFVEKFVSLKKKVTRKQLRRILKNPYPLPEY